MILQTLEILGRMKPDDLEQQERDKFQHILQQLRAILATPLLYTRTTSLDPTSYHQEAPQLRVVMAILNPNIATSAEEARDSLLGLLWSPVRHPLCLHVSC